MKISPKNFIASQALYGLMIATVNSVSYDVLSLTARELLCKKAYEYADEMLRAREK